MTKNKQIQRLTPEEQKRILEIGRIGENLVRDLLLKNGYKNVTLSDYRFNNKKDMIADGQTVEVKTLVPIFYKNAFCIGSNQIEKCLNVDHFMCVEITRSGNDITIYEFKNIRKRRKESFNGDNCTFFELTKDNIYGTIEDKSKAAELRALSPSEYLRGYNV
jgi:hypothetical protein